jgi:hypothetical protein
MNTQKKHKSHNYTVKRSKRKRANGKRENGKVLYEKQGWKVIEIRGNPFERGYAHGVLLWRELQYIRKLFSRIVEDQLKVKFQTFYSAVIDKIAPVIKNKYPEFYKEICGISAGAKSKSVAISVNYLIAWNSLLSLYSYFDNVDAYRCSAFIATGNATESGEIVMAHNTHCDYITGQMQNIIMYVYPTEGHSFVMQTAAGYIASGIDWFICSSGIMGCETTIVSTDYKIEFGAPYFCRIRQAMQYGNTLEDYVDIMVKDNAGDYACSWMFGDTNTNEIMLFELGKEVYSSKKTANGVYYGMNSVLDTELRLKETDDTDIFDLEKSTGARNMRFNYLLNDKYFGKINVSNSKSILSDHYDVYLNKNMPNQRSICKHGVYSTPPSLFGNVDGKVVTSAMAKKLEFVARYGPACGRVFDASEFISENPKYVIWKDVLKDFDRMDWIRITTKDETSIKK